MIRFTWKYVSETEVELTARDGTRIIKQRFDKSMFWLQGEDLEAFKRRLERRLASPDAVLGTWTTSRTTTSRHGLPSTEAIGSPLGRLLKAFYYPSPA
jgi:hypothetical protein